MIDDNEEAEEEAAVSVVPAFRPTATNKATAANTATTTMAVSAGDGYLGRILNAKVYDVAVETELQHAKNLSQVSRIVIEIR